MTATQMLLFVYSGQERHYVLAPASRPAKVDAQLPEKSHRRPRLLGLDPTCDGGIAAKLTEAYHQQRRILRTLVVSSGHRRRDSLRLSGTFTLVIPARKWAH